jgi:hypothetical protein
MIKAAGVRHVPGSFRDPANRVYRISGRGAKAPRILRGVDAESLSNFEQLSSTAFFKRLMDEGRIVKTEILGDSDNDANEIRLLGWAGVLSHEPIPFVSYPYEWTFGMLKSAALLQLRILEDAVENDWTLKDATPFNIQFVGSRPTFIDIPSFEPRIEGEPWVGYRQFCSCFLTPLMMRAYLRIDHLPLMRSYIDGIPPTEAVKFFRGTARMRKGVLSHLVFPARVENKILAKERDDTPAQVRNATKHSKTMVLGLLESLRRLVRRLSIEMDHSDWSEYDQTHSYVNAEHEAKKDFVKEHVSASHRDTVWDIGCNTGTFSRISAGHSCSVIAIDGDHNAVEKLYRAERKSKNSSILPIVMNLANISPNQGWAGTERTAFDQRSKPDVVLVLALVHHIRISANIPLDLFLAWLRSLDAEIIIEFVNRDDEMVVKLLTNKKEQYADYNLEQFLEQVATHFTINDRKSLKGGKREIFHLIPA